MTNVEKHNAAVVKLEKEMIRDADTVADALGECLADDFMIDILKPMTEAQARRFAEKVANSVRDSILGDWEYIQDNCKEGD